MRWLLFMAALLWPGTIFGQAVTVRSGEHAGFTRLVLTFPEPAGWDFGRTADGYGFRSRQPGQRFDIATVYDRVPRNRLSAIWVDPGHGVLRLGLGCDCHAIAEPFRPGIVVIDIHDGPPPANSPQEATLNDAGATLPPTARRNLSRPRPRPADFLPPPTRLVIELPPPPTVPPLTLTLPDPRAEALQDGLARSLAAAIASGAATPALGQRRPARIDPAFGPRIISDPDLPLASPPTQLRVRAPDERPTAARTAATTTTTCIANDRLDIATWAGTEPVAQQFAAAHSGLLGEFDRPDPDKVIALVRLYIHHGFGREARNQLATWAVNHPERALLDTLGRLVDGDPADGLFTGQQGCTGPAALWSVLASPGPRLPEGSDSAMVLQAFSALPPTLRGHLGRALAERFLASGDPLAARAVRDMIDRAPGDAAGTVAIIDAHLDSGENRVSEAEARLDGLAQTNPALAPAAVAALVESTIRRGDIPPPEMLTALAAMLQEHRSGPDAPALRHALAQGVLLAGDHRQAFHELAPRDEAVVTTLWALLAARGSDIALAESAIAPPAEQIDLLPAATRMAIADRLAQLGFNQNASAWLAPLRSIDADLLRARIALNDSDGRSALRLVAAQTEPEAMRLRAEALEQLGDTAGAEASWLELGEEERALRQRFLAHDWVGADGIAQPTAQRLLALHRQATVEPAADGALTHGRQLLAEARDARDEIAAALALQPRP